MQREYAAPIKYPGWEDNIETQASRFCNKIKGPLFFDAGANSTRQMNQSGYFAVIPNVIEENDNNISSTLKEFDLQENIPDDQETYKTLKKFIVPAEKKESILSSLNNCGINEVFLFCDDTNIIIKNIDKEQKSKFEACD